MTEIDGIPLSQAARRNLAVLVRAVNDAQGNAKPGQEQPADKIAATVLAAFKRGHKVQDGQWVPRTVFRLAGGAIVARDPNA